MSHVKPRLQVEDAVPRARLRPVATPVDTFVETNAGEGTAQLARALAKVSPSVGQLAHVLGTRDDAAEKERGEQQAREIAESGKTYQQAIKEGLITADKSPWFKLGAKEQFGRVTADKFATDLSLAVANDPRLQESVEAEEFDAFAVEFRKNWMEQNVGDARNRDLHFENGFGPRADAYLTDTRRQFAAQAGQRLIKAVGDQQYQEQFGVLEDAIRRNLTPDALAEGLNLANDRALATGLNPRVANDMTIKAVADIVMRERNPALFEVLKQVRGGSGFLYGTKQAQEAMRDAVDYVSVKVQSDNVARRQQEAETRAETERTILTGAAQALVNAPNKRAVNLAPFIQQAAAAGNTQLIRELTSLQDTLEGEQFETNPQVLNDTLAAIWTPGGGISRRSLVGLLTNKQIDPQTFSFLENQLQSRDAQASGGVDAEGRDPNRNSQFRDATVRLRSMFVSDFAQRFEPHKHVRASRAHFEFTKRWLSYWQAEGATATYAQRNEWLAQQVEDLANTYGAEETRPGDMPSLPGGPSWEDKAVITPALLNQLEQQDNSPTGLSDLNIRKLQMLNVRPEDLSFFLRTQRALISTGRRPELPADAKDNTPLPPMSEMRPVPNKIRPISSIP